MRATLSGGKASAALYLLPRTYRQRGGKIRNIDQTAGMAAFADAATLVECFDLETDHAALDRDHFCRGAHGDADRRRGEMFDVDLGADGDPTRFQIRRHRIGRRHLHFQDHHRRRIDHRHMRHEMPDGALRRHHQRALRAHADFDDFACVHLKTCIGVVPANAGTHTPRSCFEAMRLTPSTTINARGYGSRLLMRNCASGPGRRGYFFAAAARSTKVLPPFILWASGASLIWITTASASTPRFFTSAC